MNAIVRFLINTFTGGLFFLLPLVVLYILARKAYDILSSILKPINRILPDHILGFDGSQIIAVSALVLLCFITGLLFRSKSLRMLVERIEDRFLSAVPGYSFIMTKLSDRLGREDDDALEPVLVQQGDLRSFGFLVEEADGLCCVFMPGAPDYKSGNVQHIPTSAITRLDIPATAVTSSLKRIGKGSLALTGKSIIHQPAA